MHQEGPLGILEAVPPYHPHYGKWRHMPQETSNARHVATLAGLNPAGRIISQLAKTAHLAQVRLCDIAPIF
jgi:hypothetical protein